MEYKTVKADKFQPDQKVTHLGDGTTMTIVRKDRTSADESYVCRWIGEHGAGTAGIFNANLLAPVDSGADVDCHFDIGDTVRLNSGGMRMTVAEIYPVADGFCKIAVKVECAWLTKDGDSMTDTFDVRMLQYSVDE